MAQMETSRTRRRVLIVIAAAAVLGVAFYLHFFLFRSMGSGPAGPPVPGLLNGLDRLMFCRVWRQRYAGCGASGKSDVARLVKNPEDEFEDMAATCPLFPIGPSATDP